MKAEEKVHITEELLDNLERATGLVDVTTEQDFLDVLKLKRAIFYIHIDWSGQERISRYVVYKSLNDLGNFGIPVFKIVDADQKKYVENWLIGQRESRKDFNYSGCGETLLVDNGVVIDYITYPGQIGFEKRRRNLKNGRKLSWCETYKIEG